MQTTWMMDISYCLIFAYIFQNEMYFSKFEIIILLTSYTINKVKKNYKIS